MQLRKMQSADLPDALQLVKSVGWNQTERDLRLFLEGPQNIYLAAEIDGQVAGTVAAIHYGLELAWISMMIVAEEFRGRGISKQLLKTLIQELQSRGYGTIKLDATPAGRPVYEKLGFVTEYTVHRLVHPQWPGLDEAITDRSIRAMTGRDLPAVIQLDKRIFGADRTALLKSLLEGEGCYVLEAENFITAYAFCRQGRKYWQIGPVCGASGEEAPRLLKAALSIPKGTAVAVDVLADKEDLIHWLSGLGFEYQRPFYRMFLRQNTLSEQISCHYLIAGPEFG